MMPLQNHFDVSHLLGHTAFMHLANSFAVYADVHDRGLGEPSNYAWDECLRYGADIRRVRRRELESCVQAVVLFQAMMEKVPFFVSTIGAPFKKVKNTEFCKSWEELISQMESSDKSSAETAFNDYRRFVYLGMRNPIIHGRKETDVQNVNKIRAPLLHSGIKSGWRAYDYLLAEAYGKINQLHEPSWSKMCEIHRVPTELDLDRYPDLDVLSLLFENRFVDGASK